MILALACCTAVLVVALALGYLAFSPSSQRFGKVHCAGLEKASRIIALTFDDGPNEPFTSQVLEILDASGVTATFFVIGKNAERYPDTIRAITGSGHVLANHSYAHTYSLPFAVEAAIERDVRKAETVIHGLTGLRTALFRPPHGLRTPRFIRALQRLGYSLVTWNDMTNDYDARESSERIAAAIVKRARPGGIINLHDGRHLRHGVDRANMIEALPTIISELRRRGYAFVSLHELLHVEAYQ